MKSLLKNKRKRKFHKKKKDTVKFTTGFEHLTPKNKNISGDNFGSGFSDLCSTKGFQKKVYEKTVTTLGNFNSMNVNSSINTQDIEDCDCSSENTFSQSNIIITTPKKHILSSNVTKTQQNDITPKKAIYTSPNVRETTQSVESYKMKCMESVKKIKKIIEFREDPVSQKVDNSNTYLYNQRLFVKKNLFKLYGLHESCIEITDRIDDILKLSNYSPTEPIFLNKFKKPIYKGSKISLADLVFLVCVEKSSNFDSNNQIESWLKIIQILLSGEKNVNVMSCASYIQQIVHEGRIVFIGFCKECCELVFVDHLLRDQFSFLPFCVNCFKQNGMKYSCYSRINEKGKIILKPDWKFCYASFIKFFLDSVVSNFEFFDAIKFVSSKLLLKEDNFFDSDFGNLLRSYFKCEEKEKKKKLIYVVLDMSDDGINLFLHSTKSLEAMSVKFKMFKEKFEKIIYTVSLWFTPVKKIKKNLQLMFLVEEIKYSLKNDIYCRISRNNELEEYIFRFFLNVTSFDLKAAAPILKICSSVISFFI